jgi:predicted ATPase/DNA-binding SARP family transcriptional activator
MGEIVSQPVVCPIRICLFGPMQVLIQDRPLPALRSRKALWLLALLALRHSRPVERVWLAGTLWPDTDQTHASANLRTNLSELRSALGDQARRLHSPTRHTLALNIEDACVDVLAFDAAIVSGKPEMLQRAAALYRGALLEDCTEEWIAQERRSREHQCLEALQALGDAALTAGDHDAAIGYFQRAVSIDPWREAARRGWMEALAQSGNRNGALRVYRELMELLRSDPNAAPDEETSALYARLRAEARQSARVLAAVPSGKPAGSVAVAAKVSGYLPHPLTDLIGREQERIEVAANLQRSRLVTLTGPGGIGKTRLAIEVAADIVEDGAAYPDGVWLVALESLVDGRQVAPQIANVVGVREEPGRSLLEHLTATLSAKRLALVLDNCEHLLEASAQVIGHLLRECPRIRILATSREAMGIIGETVWPTPALTAPDPKRLAEGAALSLQAVTDYESVQLFVERAQARQKGFALTQSNAITVAQICAQLDGIPLAIEFAAASVNAMTVEEIALRLHDQLGLLTTDNRTAHSRQQTLRATLDWSYEMLSEPERVLLMRLSVFAGGWTLEAAEQICGDSEFMVQLPPIRQPQTSPVWPLAPPDTSCQIQGREVLDLLTALVEKSLVAFEPRGSHPRYRLLETVRQYAAERMSLDAARDRLQTRHRNWMVTFVEMADAQLNGPEPERWLKRMEIEQDNLRAALAWAERDPEGAEAGLRLLGAVWRFWERRGDLGEKLEYSKRSLARPEAQQPTMVRARALNAAGGLAARQGEYATAREFYQQSRLIARDMGNRQAIAASLSNEAEIARLQSDYAGARALLEESLVLLRELGRDRLGRDTGMGSALQKLGNLHLLQSDYAAARPLFAESLEICREQGDRRGIAFALHSLGGVDYRLGDLRAAQARFEESLSLFRELEDRFGAAISLGNLANIAKDLATVQEEFLYAEGLYKQTMALFEELEAKPGIAQTLQQLGEVAALRGDYEESQKQLGEALRFFDELGDREGIASTRFHQANTTALQGDYLSAQSLLARSLALWSELGNRQNIAEALDALAFMALEQSDARRAVQLWGAASALREDLGASLLLNKQSRKERELEQARMVLGEAVFHSDWQQGHALTWTQAVEYALAHLSDRNSQE